MKSSLFTLAALLLLCLPALAVKITPLPPPESKSTVSAVNAKTHEVSIIFKSTSYKAAKLPVIYTIDDLSTITINSVPCKFEDIRVGMIVQGTTERDAHTLDNITLEGSGLTPAAPAPAKPKPKPATTT
jgi:hypothetical protein